MTDFIRQPLLLALKIGDDSTDTHMRSWRFYTFFLALICSVIASTLSCSAQVSETTRFIAMPKYSVLMETGNPPRLIGDLNTPAGDNSQVFSPTSGFPAINVPMGYSRGGTLPVGITFYGRAWSEAQLIKLAYAYEQATKHRRPPISTPPLR